MALDVEATALSTLRLTRTALVVPELVAGRYRLLEPLGEGGMGVVHRAFDLDLDRLVELTAAANPRLSAFFSQIVCELLCSLGDPARAGEFLALADRGNLSDWQWIAACPVLGPLRAKPGFAEVQGRVRARSDAVADAVWS